MWPAHDTKSLLDGYRGLAFELLLEENHVVYYRGLNYYLYYFGGSLL